MIYTYIEDFTTDLCMNLNIHEPHHLDMFSIAKKLNVNIVYWKANFRFDNDIVLVKSTKEIEWQRFCHELGHNLRNVGQQLNMHYLFRDLQEYQANQFAHPLEKMYFRIFYLVSCPSSNAERTLPYWGTNSNLIILYAKGVLPAKRGKRTLRVVLH